MCFICEIYLINNCTCSLSASTPNLKNALLKELDDGEDEEDEDEEEEGTEDGEEGEHDESRYHFCNII